MESHRNGKILALLFTGVLMGALDISIVGPAIPAIEQTIHVTHKDLSWIFSIYVLFNLIGVSFLAKLSDVYGRRNIYILSVGLFAIGSAIVSFAGSISTLLIGRAVQGFGASGIFPVASALIGDIYPPEKRGRTIGLIGAVFGIAFIIGPVIAGVLMLWFSWNSLFIINLPIAAVIIFYAWRLMPSHRKPGRFEFDWPGLALITILLVSLFYGLNNIEAARGFKGFISMQVLPFLLVAIAALFVFVFIEKRSQSPVVKIELFDVKQIRIAGLVAIAAGMMQSVTIFVPEMAVKVYGVSTSQASFMLLPFVAAIAIGSPTSGRMIDRVGSRAVVITGLTVAALGLLMFKMGSGMKPYFYTAGIMLGLGTSMLQGSSLRYIMLNEVAVSERALGQGVITLFTSLGQMSGATVIGILVASAIGGISGYSNSFVVIAIIALVVMLLSTRLKSRGAELASASESID